MVNQLVSSFPLLSHRLLSIQTCSTSNHPLLEGNPTVASSFLDDPTLKAASKTAKEPSRVSRERPRRCKIPEIVERFWSVAAQCHCWRLHGARCKMPSHSHTRSDPHAATQHAAEAEIWPTMATSRSFNATSAKSLSSPLIG